MSSESSNQDLLLAWKNGDHAAAAVIFRRYQARLLALVRAHLSRKLARRVDAEDVLLSAYRSFFIAVQRGCGTQNESDDLWPLLTTFVLRKLARQARYHGAERRSIDEESSDGSMPLESLISREPTADHAAMLADEIEKLMSGLDETAREVLVRTLQGQDVVSIASELRLHERSVRRALERIRDLLPRETNDSLNSTPFPGSISRQRPIPQKPNMTLQGTVNYCDYVLKRFIGAGAFSKVYCATKRSSGETVAIKFLRKECWYDDRAVAALIREFEILRRLHHPLILAIHGWGRTPAGAIFLVMDYIKGKTLAEWRVTVKPSARQIVCVVSEIAAALTIVHSQNIVHGDLKPSNILIRDDGRITLCDFGLSRYVTDPDDTPRGGTAGFLAPEQISDAFGAISPLTDVYGLGGLFFAMLTGHPPMKGRDLPEIMANVLSPSLPEAPTRQGDVFSKELDTLILRCLEKDPHRRFPSMRDLLMGLANLMDQ